MLKIREDFYVNETEVRSIRLAEFTDQAEIDDNLVPVEITYTDNRTASLLLQESEHRALLDRLDNPWRSFVSAHGGTFTPIGSP